MCSLLHRHSTYSNATLPPSQHKCLFLSWKPAGRCEGLEESRFLSLPSKYADCAWRHGQGREGHSHLAVSDSARLRLRLTVSGALSSARGRLSCECSKAITGRSLCMTSFSFISCLPGVSSCAAHLCRDQSLLCDVITCF